MMIRITSKLSESALRALRAHAAKQDEFGPTYERAYTRVSRLTYEPAMDASETSFAAFEKPAVAQAHSVARRMMIDAGTTFTYEIF